MSADTETPTKPATEVFLTPIMRQVIEHMLQDPRRAHHLVGICQALNLWPGTVSPLLRRMLAAGWVSRVPGPGNRKFYRFTTGSTTVLRKKLRTDT